MVDSRVTKKDLLSQRKKERKKKISSNNLQCMAPMPHFFNLSNAKAGNSWALPAKISTWRVLHESSFAPDGFQLTLKASSWCLLWSAPDWSLREYKAPLWWQPGQGKDLNIKEHGVDPGRRRGRQVLNPTSLSFKSPQALGTKVAQLPDPSVLVAFHAWGIVFTL